MKAERDRERKRATRIQRERGRHWQIDRKTKNIVKQREKQAVLKQDKQNKTNKKDKV